MPVLVTGVGQDGHKFNIAAEIVNGSTAGMGFLLDLDPDPSVPLLITIFHNQRVFQIQGEVRHVTYLENSKRLVGIRFLRVRLNH
jgi:PilZ domain